MSNTSELIRPNVTDIGKSAVPLKIVTAAELLELDLPAPAPIVDPAICEGDLVMFSGPRGVGKTWISLGLAMAISVGRPFLGWAVPTPRKVLFLDAEMKSARFGARIKQLAENEAGLDNLSILNRDFQGRGAEWPDLAQVGGQNVISGLVAQTKSDVVVIDNLSGWCRSGASENDEESWRTISNWLMTLRAGGVTVILIHHTGKNGQQRGTSKREDILDTSILIKKPEEGRGSSKLCVLSFSKNRNFPEDEAQDILVSLVERSGRLELERANSISPIFERLSNLIAEGKPRDEILEELKIDRFALDRLAKKARVEGLKIELPDGRKK